MPPGGAGFLLSSQVLEFNLFSVSPFTSRQQRQCDLKIEGGQFDHDMTFSPHRRLWCNQHCTIGLPVDSSVAYATFSLDGLPSGLYDLQADHRGSARTLSDAVDVGSRQPGRFQVRLVTPEAIRVFRPTQLLVVYENLGSTDLVAPVVKVVARNGVLAPPVFWGRRDGPQELVGTAAATVSGGVDFSGMTNRQLFLAIGREGPAGILRPGASVTLMSMFGTMHGNAVSLSAETIDPDSPADWSALKEDIKPAFAPADGWETVFANFHAAVGDTWGQTQEALADDATYLSRLGVYSSDLIDCWGSRC